MNTLDAGISSLMLKERKKIKTLYKIFYSIVFPGYFLLFLIENSIMFNLFEVILKAFCDLKLFSF